MAYAMGIIDDDYRRKIDLIREIRNACAHCRHPLNLDNPALLEPIKISIKDMWKDLKDNSTKTIRLAFVAHCRVIGFYILTGEKYEGLSGHARLLDRLIKIFSDVPKSSA